jgi:hypothetical protein
MKSGQGSFSTKRTRFGARTWISFTLSFRSFAPLPLYRSKLNFTSSAVTGSPVWKRAFFRMTNS